MVEKEPLIQGVQVDLVVVQVAVTQHLQMVQATQPGTNPSPFVTDYGFPGGFSTPTGGYAPAGGGGAGQQVLMLMEI